MMALSAVDDLVDGIAQKLEAAMSLVAGRMPDHEIAGVGIATDADAVSIVAFANSRRNLERMVAEEPEYAIDSRWHLGEWDMDATQLDAGDPLASLRTEALRVRGVVEDASAEKFRLRVWSAIATALAGSAASGFFDRWPNAVRVFLPLDADVSFAQIAEWNAPLNDTASHQEFRAFLQLD